MTMAPEAALANRIATRHGFKPSDDLQNLVSQYADIESLQFPMDSVDGISLYLKFPSPPPEHHHQFQHFAYSGKVTLAHEFGHVIIPWRFGMFFLALTLRVLTRHIVRLKRRWRGSLIITVTHILSGWSVWSQFKPPKPHSLLI
jgi:hypothetical protein